MAVNCDSKKMSGSYGKERCVTVSLCMFEAILAGCPVFLFVSHLFVHKSKVAGKMNGEVHT